MKFIDYIRHKESKISIVILSVSSLILLISALIGLRYNVDSVYDEGFLFHSINEAITGNVSGMSQYKNIISSFLGEDICNSLYLLRLSRIILTCLTSIFFYIITVTSISQLSHKKYEYLVLCIFFVSPSFEGIVLSYNGLAQFFLSISIALSFVVLQNKKFINLLLSFLIGICIIFAIFTILPSAVLLLTSIIILYLIKYWSAKRHLLFLYVTFLLGLSSGLCLIHLYVCDLYRVYQEMLETANSITSLNRGYDPINFIIKALLFLRDSLFCIFVIVGIISLSNVLRKYKLYFISFIFVIVSLLMYIYYQEKPRVTYVMLLISMIIITLNSVRFSEFNFSNLKKFDTIYNVFLLFSPIILSIGTNIYLGYKIAYFLLPWSLLLYRVGWNNLYVKYRLEICLFLLILALTRILSTYEIVNNDLYEVTKGPLYKMHLTQKQYEHYAECSKILAEYNFKEKESVIYGTQLSSMTICYLNAINCANYFQPMDFVAHSKFDSLKIPDFIFLCEYDKTISGEALDDMNWGWPDEFDEYYVGSPETIETGYPTERWLYCRKNLKK